MEMRVIQEPRIRASRFRRVSTNSEHFSNLQPTEYPVLGMAGESPRRVLRVAGNGPEESPEKEKISSTDALVREMALGRSDLAECASPIGPPRPQGRVDIGIQVTRRRRTNATLGDIKRQVGKAPRQHAECRGRRLAGRNRE